MTESESTASEHSTIVIAIALILCALLLYKIYFQDTDQYKANTGIVQSSGPVNRGKLGGGTREVAMVKLSDGTVVIAHVLTAAPLAPGEEVNVSLNPNAIGPPEYEILSKR